MVKNLSCKAGDVDSIPGPETRIPQASEQLSLSTTTYMCVCVCVCVCVWWWWLWPISTYIVLFDPHSNPRRYVLFHTIFPILNIRKLILGEFKWFLQILISSRFGVQMQVLQSSLSSAKGSRRPQSWDKNQCCYFKINTHSMLLNGVSRVIATVIFEC